MTKKELEQAIKEVAKDFGNNDPEQEHNWEADIIWIIKKAKESK